LYELFAGQDTNVRQRGFSLLEFVVVVIVIGVAAGFALDRMLPLIGRAERIAFVQVQSQLKSALLLEAAERITRGESRTLLSLDASNPMGLLLTPPANYRGAVPAVNEYLPAATWVFDESRRRLVYRVGKFNKFEALSGPNDMVELEVQFAYRDRDSDGVYNPSVDSFGGLKLAAVNPYRWPD
jgi:general secretion pathway protein G